MTDHPPLTEPTFDADGYPTEETLDAIRHWPVNDLRAFEAVMDFVGRAWRYPDYWGKTPHATDPEAPTRRFLRYAFSTGGWSGNESLVGAIEANAIVQNIGAWAWRRGGHYEYRFPEADHD